MLTKFFIKKLAVILGTALLLFTSCSKKQELSLSDGTFTGRGAGRNGPIVVEVTVKDGKVSDAKIIEQQETEDIGFPIEAEIIEEFLNHGGDTDIDAISGATLTSNALISALKAALDASHGIIEAKGPRSTPWRSSRRRSRPSVRTSPAS